MNKLTTTLSLIFIILIIAVIVYFKSQVSYYKNAYEGEVKKYNDYIASQTIILNDLQNKNNQITNKYKSLKLEAEQNALNSQKNLNNIVSDNQQLLGRLHQQIDNSNSQLSCSNTDTKNIGLTYYTSFRECSAQLVEMAKIADQYVIDIKLLQEAWPTNENTSN